MKPILLDKTKTLTALATDKTNGIGRLSDVISCTVTEDLNSAYTATMTYPVSGVFYDRLVTGALIKLKPNLYDQAQIFRIEKISKPINEIVTINMNHISYDLKKTSVLPFTANGATMTLVSLKQHMQGGTAFNFATNVSDGKTEFKNEVPVSARTLIGGGDTNFLSVFGGECEWNNLLVNIVQRRGADNGVKISYGVDLTDITHDESVESVYTHVQPYITISTTEEVSEGETQSVQKTIVGDLQEVIANVPEANREILNVDLSSEFSGRQQDEPEPTVEEINTACQKYIDDNNIGVPSVSMTISFLPLWQTEEYKNIAPLKRVSLGDTVHIDYHKIGIQAEARVISYTWNVLSEKYDSLSLGDVKSTLAGTIAGIESDIATGNIGGNGGLSTGSQTQVDQIVQNAIKKATELLTGAYGGYMVIGTNADGQPNELFFMDTNDKATATKVIRLNSNGIGASVTGINGPYIASMLIDGTINASRITFGELDGNLIKANTIMAGALDEVLGGRINDSYDNAADAIDKAQQAQNSANNAQATADGAQSSASNAQNTANTALETADDAYKQALEVQSAAAQAQGDANEANRLAQGALDGLSELSNAFFVDSVGAHVRDTSGSETVIQGDGMHNLVEGEEVARFTPNDSHVNNLAVSQFLMFGAHRAELVTINGEQCTGFFWIGDVL